VHLRLTLFHHLVNEELPNRGHGTVARGVQPVIVADGAAPPSLPILGENPGWIEGHPFPRPSWVSNLPPQDASYLRIEDVRELINRASFLAQEHGVLFNASFELRPSRFGVETEVEARRLVEDFCSDLQNAVRTWCGNDEALFAHLTLYERLESGLRALVVAYLPRPAGPYQSVGQDCVAAAGAWRMSWRQHLRAGVASDAVTFESGPTGEGLAWKFHWRQILNLCAGLSENDEVPNPKTGIPAPLLKLLKVPQRSWRIAGPIDGPPISASASLQPEAIARASRNRMEPLSAFDAQAWDWIRSNWELKEHRHHQDAKAKRADELAYRQEVYAADAGALRAALEELAHRWPATPERRLRRWQGW
jgi:hypothetical protein